MNASDVTPTFGSLESIKDLDNIMNPKHGDCYVIPATKKHKGCVAVWRNGEWDKTYIDKLPSDKPEKKEDLKSDINNPINNPDCLVFMKYKHPEEEEVGFIEYRPYKAKFNGYKTLEEAVKYGDDLFKCMLSSATMGVAIVHALILSNTHLTYTTRRSCQEDKVILSIPVDDIGLEFAKKIRSVVSKIETLRELTIRGKVDDYWNELHAKIDRERQEIMEQFIEEHNLVDIAYG
jgi:hypothetical protein